MLNLFNRIFGRFLHSKKKSMNFDKNKSDEELIQELSKLDFQWIKGDLMGSVEKFESMESTDLGRFIVFQGGGRINIELVGEYMDCYPSISVDISSVPVKEIPLESTRILEPKVGAVMDKQLDIIPRKNQVIEKKGHTKDSPIHSLLEKQKSNKKRIDISISLDLPSKALFSVLSDSFDDAENEVIEYALMNLDPEDIRKSLKVSIRKMYEKTGRSKSPTE